nr:MAG TPA: hypothetical protein [Caudoviricetes sp.]
MEVLPTWHVGFRIDQFFCFLFATYPVAQADYPASPYSLSLEYNIAC